MVLRIGRPFMLILANWKAPRNLIFRVGSSEVKVGRR